jgi:hypothetical protein
VIAVDVTTCTVIFVEVKTRTSDQFGRAQEAVTPDKVRRLRRLTGLWLAGQGHSWARADRCHRRADRTAAQPRDHPSARGGVMTLGRAFSVAVRGVDGEIVESKPIPPPGCRACIWSGCPTRALQESRDRVRAAITNCGNSWPIARLTLTLSPATVPKMGSVYDLAHVLA